MVRQKVRGYTKILHRKPVKVSRYSRWDRGKGKTAVKSINIKYKPRWRKLDKFAQYY